MAVKCRIPQNSGNVFAYWGTITISMELASCIWQCYNMPSINHYFYAYLWKVIRHFSMPYHIHSFIPLACAECDDSLPFSGASSIPLCYALFPATLLHQLFFHPLSSHLAIYFLVYLSSILLFPNSYIIPFWEFYFQKGIIYEFGNNKIGGKKKLSTASIKRFIECFKSILISLP